MSKHLIVISEDALVYEDLETLCNLPNFSHVLQESAVVEGLRTVYPTLTYPAHTSMRTGVYPARHGIVNNETPVLCEASSVWHLYHKDVKVPDLFDAAKAAGLTTASVFWPVTRCHPSIDYLINEYWPQTPDETTLECFAASGSSPGMMEKVIRPNAHLVDGRHRQHPHCDHFINACACAILRTFTPNLLMIHPANIDAYRHKTGLFSPHVTHGLHEIDNWLGDLLAAAEDAGILQDTHFCILGDHGQLNIQGSMHLNVLLRELGWIDVDADGVITDYRAFCKSSGLSAQVYLKNPNDTADCKAMYALL